jgi:hypothetical protein
VQGSGFCSKTDHKKQRYQRKAIFQISEKMIVSGASKKHVQFEKSKHLYRSQGKTIFEIAVKLITNRFSDFAFEYPKVRK